MDDGHGKLTFGQGATPTPESANDVRHCQEFTELHVITKNVQSIQDPSRFDDFLAEIDTCDFDILCICETWRGDDSDDSAAFAEDIRLQVPRTCQLIKTPAAAETSAVQKRAGEKKKSGSTFRLLRNTTR